ncbi:TetR family transcriptional regulator [Thermoleophilia bacterium SCSIO 60948]|nr:TetR family transcriptional regulator [Thermoleophilia bacterium SCSIO 60948]
MGEDETGDPAGARGRRSQADRRRETRAKLIAAATRLFGEHGYAAVSTTAVADAAGVTRGALYHHFADKGELFADVYETLERDLLTRAGKMLEERSGDGVADALLATVEMLLDACLEPATVQILLRDAPAVLGWARWREIGMRYGLGLIEASLNAGIEAGELRRAPVRPTAHAMLGAFDELALWVANSDDPSGARDEASETMRLLIDDLRRAPEDASGAA